MNILTVDKTGTLTEGRPRLTSIIPVGSLSEDALLAAAAAVEQNSEHPLAAAIVQGARDRGITIPGVSDFESTTGGGVIGHVEGREVVVGKPEFLHSRGINGCDQLERKAAELQKQGQTAVFVALAGQPAGILVVADPIRKSTPGAIAHLHQLGMKIIMLTGDNERTARAVAEKLGIDEVEAGVEPQHKKDGVRALREKKNVVAMAGDGINDAPLLPRLMSASPWAPAPTWQWKAPASHW